jgi:hypothetical protein
MEKKDKFQLKWNSQYPNSGSMWQVTVKTSDKGPDRKGEILIDPKDFPLEEDGKMRIQLGGWLRQSASGNSFLSIKCEKPWVPKDGPVKSETRVAEEDTPF